MFGGPHNKIFGVYIGIPFLGGFPKLGARFWGSHHKDYSILGSILDPPNQGNYNFASSAARFNGGSYRTRE